MKLNIITPCGGAAQEVEQTCLSVDRVAKACPKIQIVHYLCFNNGLKAGQGVCPSTINPDGLERVVVDINPAASRAQARNTILAKIENFIDSFVLFLDSGDLLAEEALSEINRCNLSEIQSENTLFLCDAKVIGKNVLAIRKPAPLRLKEIVNPFYLGSVIVSSSLATKVKFQEGRKEDWKYWLEILFIKPDIKRIHQVNYIYNVISTNSHITRKSKLIKDQYYFFKDYIKKPPLIIPFYLVAHYGVLIFNWYFLYKINRLMGNNNSG